MKSCRWQAVHLQLLSEATAAYTAHCSWTPCCVQNYIRSKFLRVLEKDQLLSDVFINIFTPSVTTDNWWCYRCRQNKQNWNLSELLRNNYCIIYRCNEEWGLIPKLISCIRLWMPLWKILVALIYCYWYFWAKVITVPDSFYSSWNHFVRWFIGFAGRLNYWLLVIIKVYLALYQ